MQKLLLAEDGFDQLNEGKNITIRKGIRDIKLGKLVFESTKKKRIKIVNVYRVSYCQLDFVTSTELEKDGFKSPTDMLNEMKSFYPNLKPESKVTVIRFR